MLVSQDLLEKAVHEAAFKTMAAFKFKGRVKPALFLLIHEMTQITTLRVGRSYEAIGKFRDELKRMVQHENPEVVILIYQLEGSVNYAAIKQITGSTYNTKDLTIVRIEASSRTANFELALVFKKQGDDYAFDHKVNVPVERRGCEHTRNVWPMLN